MLFHAVPAVAGAISLTLVVVSVPWFLLPGDSRGSPRHLARNRHLDARRRARRRRRCDRGGPRSTPPPRDRHAGRGPLRRGPPLRHRALPRIPDRLSARRAALARRRLLAHPRRGPPDRGGRHAAAHQQPSLGGASHVAPLERRRDPADAALRAPHDRGGARLPRRAADPHDGAATSARALRGPPRSPARTTWRWSGDSRARCPSVDGGTRRRRRASRAARCVSREPVTPKLSSPPALADGSRGDAQREPTPVLMRRTPRQRTACPRPPNAPPPPSA